MAGQKLRICCVTDNKPGHRSQLEGLERALAALTAVEVEWLDVSQPSRMPEPRPDLILAAGRRTHWRALRLKWKHRAPLVVLMKPGLPLRLFDLCVVPEHDGLRPSPRVLVTRGMLNNVAPATGADPVQGLVLLGGPSKHHGWVDEELLAQLAELRRLLPDCRWQVTTSRRTPASLDRALQTLVCAGLEFTPASVTGRDWVREQLQRCGTVWVSEDSASMVYEALSAGARVGVLGVPRRRESRVSRGLEKLLREGLLTDLPGLSATGAMTAPVAPLQEAARVAQYLLQWLRPGLSKADNNENTAGTA